jgi:hypothetical protein
MGWAVFSGKLVQKVVVSKLELKNKKVQKNLPKTPNYFLPFEKFRTFALFQNNLKTVRSLHKEHGLKFRFINGSYT